MDKLTFGEYIESTVRLREALKEPPVVRSNYKVKRYCRLRVGESTDAREEFSLRPASTISIDWEYKDMANPTPVTVVIEHTENKVYWSAEKLKSWLKKNTTEDLL